MKDIKIIEKIRRIRLGLYLISCSLFVVILIINKLFINEEWLYTMIIFDNVLLLGIFCFLIEHKIGGRYEEMYHVLILPELFNRIHLDYKNLRNTDSDGLKILQTKLFEPDCDVILNNVVRVNKGGLSYEIYDVHLMRTTYKMNQVTIYKGYVCRFINKDFNHEMILYNKKPAYGNYNKIYSFNKYRIYSEQNNITREPSAELKTKLLDQLAHNNKYDLCMSENVLIFKSYFRSLYSKPIFRNINEKFMDDKLKQILRLIDNYENFMVCFE